jgi:hypothetical protein
MCGFNFLEFPEEDIKIVVAKVKNYLKLPGLTVLFEQKKNLGNYLNNNIN